MTLRHLNIFSAVCREGSMTKASVQLGMAQPPVSQAVAELERYYGTLLFERRGRRLYLTTAGTRLEAYATHVERLLAEARTNLRELEESGDLRVGASKTVGAELLPAVSQRFHQEFPLAELTLFVDNTAVVLEKLRAAELDIALIEGVIADDQFVVEPLREDEMVLICSPDHRWAQGPRINKEDLAGERFLVREQGSGTRESFESTMEVHGLPWTLAGEVSDAAAILALVASGVGLAFLSSLTASRALMRREVVRIEVQGLRMVRTFRLAIHGNKRMSPSLVRFTNLAHEIALDRA